MKNESRYSFGTDFHGNLQNIDAFLRISKEAGVDHIIFGGDLSPKKMAVAFADGNGMPVSESPHETKRSNVTARELRERGYMLFGSEYTADQIHRMMKVASKMLAIVSPDAQHYERPRLTNVTEEDLRCADRDIAPLMIQFIETKANDAFKRFLSLRQSRVGTEEMSIKDFVKNFIGMFKTYFLFDHGLRDDRSVSGRILLGNERASEEDLIAATAGYCDSLCGPYQSMIYFACTNGMPWSAWNETEHHIAEHSLDHQKSFLKELFSRLQSLRQTFHGSISLILGNDDRIELLDNLEDAHREGLILHATSRVVDLSPDVQMLGYAHVPNAGHGFYPAWFKDESTIHEELLELAKGMRTNATQIANIHSPPSNSALAKAIVDGKQRDFGSVGVRSYIEEGKPHIALTGHIHRSWEVTGKVQDTVGETVIYNPGDSEFQPRFLLAHLLNPEHYTLVK